ncbi:S8 family peptidase [Streptomyces sp. NPDC017979]|uniref:S8 family peptidase n=1 Tax=Streptomyces sp. NPDC017979 TaxID=3365024 RepID=UPI0037A9ED22
MRRRVLRVGRTTVAVGVGVVLSVGMVGPGADRAPGGGARASGPGAQAVTLVTGDRVVLGERGQVVEVRRAEGREGMPVLSHTAGGRTYVVPYDAQQLLAAGALDERLFDVTELSRPESRAAYADGLKVIVSYRSTKAKEAREGVRGADGVAVHRTLESANADAVTAAPDSGAALWRALTRTGRDGAVAPSAGISRIWLDGIKKASLDTTVAQIGAPAVWQRKYDGSGVTVAVLDTGVDAAHPDLRGKVVGAANFSTSPGTEDRHGHGTHVASTAAGTGAKSGGVYKGVAPGAQVLNAKVLSDFGSGSDSGIMAGIDWAVAHGADVVNLSLGGPDSVGVDPVEAQVNALTEQKGVLFAIAAGNSGPDARTLGSPGAADAALTVGAVDGDERLAEFSSRGPRRGDSAAKPDVTAPGVDVTAASAAGSAIEKAVGQRPEGYVTISGTSMATPHVAGAAALLKQQHPDWTAAELKSALVGSAVPGSYPVPEQGTGRIAVDRAVAQSVTAAPAVLDLGPQLWPREDDAPITRKLTYRNSGTAAVALELALAGASGPGGAAAPAGLFALGQRRVTVPAGGSVAVDVTADTDAVGAQDAGYHATVVATGGGQSVRTAVSVDREGESYDVTLNAVGRDGRPDTNAVALLYAMTGEGADAVHRPNLSSGSASFRLPKGRYFLDASSYRAGGDGGSDGATFDKVLQPELNVTGKTTVTVDARSAEPVLVSVPDARAQEEMSVITYGLDRGRDALGYSSFTGLESGTDLRTAHLGPDSADGRTAFSWHGSWSGPDRRYDVAVDALRDGRRGRFPTGLAKKHTRGEFARIKVGLGSSVPGKRGELLPIGEMPNGAGFGYSTHHEAGGHRDVWLSTGDGVAWDLRYGQWSAEGPSGDELETLHGFSALRAFRPGTSHRIDFNTAVHGPLLDLDSRLARQGDAVYGQVPLVADGRGHPGDSTYTSATTTLHRGSELVTRIDDDLLTDKVLVEDPLFTLPAGRHTYTLASSVRRSADVSRVAGRVDASWTFTSDTAAAETVLPLSTVRFVPSVGLDSTAPAGRRQTFPVTVQGAAAGRNLAALRVHASYDGGATWREVPVRRGRITLVNPRAGEGVALRAHVVDRQGNSSSVTIHDAYLGR